MTFYFRFYPVLALLLFLTACHKKAPPPLPAEVGVITVSTQTVTLTTELPGRVVAHRVADVRPQVGGVVLHRLFTEGGNVEEGQALYQIDPAPFQAALENARASVEKASATVTSSTALLNRYRPLVEANAVSKQDFDNAQAAQLSAMADLTAAQAALSLARINLVYTRVLSPISGRIGRSSVTEGALVTANQETAIATVQQLNPIYVDVTQPSTLLMRLRRQYDAGLLRRAGKNQAVVHLRLEDDTSYNQVGKLQFSEVTVDPGTGAVTLRAVFPNPKETLLPGMFVHEIIPEGLDDQALLIPQRGVSHDQRGEPIAYVLGKDGKVELRTLKTDRAIGDQWLVTSGLQTGDRVIVEGLQKIMPGAPAHGTDVSLSTATAPAAPSAPAPH